MITLVISLVEVRLYVKRNSSALSCMRAKRASDVYLRNILKIKLALKRKTIKDSKSNIFG